MKSVMQPQVFAAVFTIFVAAVICRPQTESGITWKHLSTRNGDLEVPNAGKEQTSTIVCDIDKDGINDFVVTERTAAPAVVWYRRTPKGWDRYILEAEPLHIEAGSTYLDIDGDGDLDIVCGGDYKSNQIWWWENPYPNFDPKVPWKRHLIKNDGFPKHHDQMFGDFDGDGKQELVFWNQEAHGLFLARIPPNPRSAPSWPYERIYSYSVDSQSEQRAESPDWKGINEHEGLAQADIDGDGLPDIVGGGRWFKYVRPGEYQANIVDAAYPFSRAAAGDLKKGGRPEIVLVVGDGTGPLIWYEWVKGTWVAHKLLDVNNGHSLSLVDFNGDGNLDIFCAEMRLDGGNPHSKMHILLGDGKGGFTDTVIAEGYGNHESKMADLDGNGTLDILGKPYNWDTPRLDIWLNMGTGRR